MDGIALSIVIAIYNADRYLRTCLDAIKACPAENIECILVNDGSVDGSRMICEEFVRADARYSLINKENTGVSDSRNAGLQKAEGKYVFFIDADDYLDADQWPAILKGAESERYDMIAYSYYTLFESGKTREKTFPIRGDETGSAEDTRRVLLTTPLLNTCWGKLLRRRVIEENRLRFRRELKTGEDAIFMIDFLENASTSLLCNRCVLYYRQHGGSAMRCIDMDAKLEDFRELFIRRNAYLELGSHLSLRRDMYLQFFSVVTDLFLQYARQNKTGKAKEAFEAAVQKKVVKDILADVDKKNLSPVFKKLEYAMLRRGWFYLLALYFSIKAKFGAN